MSKNKRESKIMEWLLVLQVGCWSQWERERWFNEKILNCMLKAGLPSKRSWKGCVRKQEEFSSSVSGKWSFFVPGDPMDRIQRSYEVCTWTTAKTSLYRLAESKGKASRHGMLKALFIPWPEQTTALEGTVGGKRWQGDQDRTLEADAGPVFSPGTCCSPGDLGQCLETFFCAHNFVLLASGGSTSCSM